MRPGCPVQILNSILVLTAYCHLPTAYCSLPAARAAPGTARGGGAVGRGGGRGCGRTRDAVGDGRRVVGGRRPERGRGLLRAVQVGEGDHEEQGGDAERSDEVEQRHLFERQQDDDDDDRGGAHQKRVATAPLPHAVGRRAAVVST